MQLYNMSIFLHDSQIFLCGYILYFCREPNWDQEISDDVMEECNKHGGVHHIYVDKASPQGNVYVKCPNIGTAVAAVNALHGRWFAGQSVRQTESWLNSLFNNNNTVQQTYYFIDWQYTMCTAHTWPSPALIPQFSKFTISLAVHLRSFSSLLS